MLYNQYRPRKFKDIVGQKMTVSSLQEQSKSEKFFSVYILCGQFGSGKTSTARILAMAANCKHKDADGNPCLCCPECKSILEGSSPDFFEIAAAVNTGVDTVRDICENAAYLPASLSKKVYIIDEVQALSKSAFQAFLKILEEPPAHAMFILATTDVGAIPPTVRSRAATYYFSQLSHSDISEHLQMVAAREGFQMSMDATDVIAKYSQGSMRNALSLLEMAAQNKASSGTDIERMMGVSTPDAVFRVIDAVLSGEAATVVRAVTELTEGGSDLAVLVNDMIGYVAELTVTSVAPDAVKGSEHYLSLLRETAMKGDASRFSAFADGLLEVKQMLRKLPEVSTLIVALIHLSRLNIIADVKPAGIEADEVKLLRATVAKLEHKVRELTDAISSGTYVPAATGKMDSVITNDSEIELTNNPSAKVVPEQVVDEADAMQEYPDILEQDTEAPTASTPVTDSDPVAGKWVEVEPSISQITDMTNSDGVLSTEPKKEVEKERVEKLPVDAVEEPDAEPVFGSMLDFLFGVSDSASLDTSVSSTGKSGVADDKGSCKKLLELASSDSLFAAALDCCEVEETLTTAVIDSEFPAVKSFIGSYLGSFMARGIDTDGITLR